MMASGSTTSAVSFEEYERRYSGEVSAIEQVRSKVRALKVHTVEEFLSIEIPPRSYLLSPILQSKGLVMLFAKRGIGKTWFAMEMAYAVARGGAFLKWHGETPRKVLYVDGEMPAETLQERLSDIVANTEGAEPPPENFRILASDLQGDMIIPDISTTAGQEAIEQHLDGVDLLVLDNLSTLCRSGNENEAESYQPIQDWCLKLRRRGMSVLLVHHAGKSGNQRGTSKREDVLDTVIRLDHPSDYSPDQGARFEVHLDKARGVMGEDAAPFEAMLGPGGWTYKTLEDARHKQIVELHLEGLKQREIASELGIGLASVNRHLKKAREAGEVS